MTTYTAVVQENQDGELFIELSDEVMEKAGFKIGDDVRWVDNGDGSWSIVKQEKPKVKTEYVLVEAVSTFRMRYVVEVPVGKSPWALDTVTMEEAKEFSQQHLGETIVSHRVIDRDEVIRLCDEDNDYMQSKSDDDKFKIFVTSAQEHLDDDLLA
jgi:hypothetical protein